jgi:conjugal transfer pilus assembly protein TraB
MTDTTKTSQVKSTQKRNLIILAGIVGVSVIALVSMLSNHSLDQTVSKTEKVNFSSPLNNIDAESIVLEKTQKELHENKKQTENLQEKLTTLTNDKNSENDTLKKSNVELNKRIAILEKQFSSVNSTSPADSASSIPGSEEYQGSLLPVTQGLNTKKSSNYSVSRGIREDNLSLSAKDSEAANIIPIKTPDTYVPAGTFAQAIMIGGADASAGVTAQNNPEPMLFRITSNGTLPNHKKSHLMDCFVTGAVIGDVSSERGKIRTEKLSCVFPNGEVVDQDVEGTIFGPDGKNAVRGNLHDGSGQYVTRAGIAGFASGISDGISQTFTNNSISAEGVVSTTNPNRIFQNGFAKGSSKGLDKISDYEIKRADQYHPIIQLSAKTEVDIVFLKGFYLDGKKHENHDSSVSNAPVNNSPTLFPSPNENADSQTLPLSPDAVRRIQENSKELGLRVTTQPNKL